jgi:hypothetical protein
LLEQAYNDATDILNVFFNNSSDFLYTQWHYQLVKKCYNGEYPNPLLEQMRTHRYNYFNNNDENLSIETYKNATNSVRDLLLNKNKLNKSSVHNAPSETNKLQKLLYKKWNLKDDTCFLNLASITKLMQLNLISHLQNYDGLKRLVHCLENQYQDLNEDILMFEFFSPRENVIKLFREVNKSKGIKYPEGFAYFVKQTKDQLSYDQYRGILEYALLFPDEIKFNHVSNKYSRLAQADAFNYAYKCWKDDINALFNTTLMGVKLNPKDDKIKEVMNSLPKYIKAHLEYDYLQRFINWILDQLRWCYNNPEKAFILLVASVYLSVILELFTPVLMLAEKMSEYVTWYTPLWVDALCSITASRGIAGMTARAIFGKQHPMLYMTNKLISNQAQKVIEHIHVNIDQINTSVQKKLLKS